MVLYMRNGGSGKVTSLLSLRGYITHYSNFIMGAMASQITSLTIVYSTVHSGADQRKHQSSASLAFYAENSPVTSEFPAQMASNAETFPFDDVIMSNKIRILPTVIKVSPDYFLSFRWENNSGILSVLVWFYIRSYPSNVSFWFIKIIWH